jgi:FtsP/CotA-like multicopper oxidase with cupredoxin domain
MTMNRRGFLLSGVALGLVPTLRGVVRAEAAPVAAYRITPRPARSNLLGSNAPDTAVWAYNDQVPGPVIRARLGQRVAIDLDNALPQATTLHWHGLRVPNAMDGVPYLTQAPVAAGGSFHYAFEARNSGTYWYHPHFRTSEQQDRGLHGVIIVEDADPPEVDRELVWVLDDWRLDGKGEITEDFGDLHDASHRGRVGNTATINGRVPAEISVRAGERIRLRLVNVANAWIFVLDFSGHAPRIVAYDGHGVAPHTPPEGRIVIGPSQRVDVILDMVAKPGQRFQVVDRPSPRQTYKLLDMVYEEEPLRDAVPAAPLVIDPPRLPEPDLSRAEAHELLLTGGAMGGMGSALYQGQTLGIRDLAGLGKVWAINGIVASRHDEPSQLTLGLGKTYILEMVNDTAFPHPMHLHGHPMKVLEVDGKAPPQTVWRDTLLLGARSRAKVALVADNPGRWMLHCHIPEHQEAGMMAVVTVA